MNILVYNLNINIVYKIFSSNMFERVNLVIHHNYELFMENNINKKINTIKYSNLNEDKLIDYIYNNSIDILLSNIQLSDNILTKITKNCIYLNYNKVKYLNIISIIGNHIEYKNQCIVTQSNPIIKQYTPIIKQSTPIIKQSNNPIIKQSTPIIKQSKSSQYEADENYLTFMNDYCKIINTSKDKVLTNPKEEFRYFCFRYLDYIRYLQLPIIAQNNNYEAVLIEYRCLPHLEFLIRNCIHKLGANWSQTIICGNLNYDYMLEMVNHIGRDIKVIKTEYDNLMPTDYSMFLSTKLFWNLLVGEKILIYQEDSCIFKNNINDFIEWDYIGAPWKKTQNDTPNNVGNGGLSLRSKSVMLKVIDTINIMETTYNSSTTEYMKNCNLTTPPEDVYFSKNIQEFQLGRVADWDSAYNFSSESCYNENSFSGHNFWLSNNTWKSILYNNVIKTYNVVSSFKDIQQHRGGWNIVKNSLKKYVNPYSTTLFIDNVDGYFLWDEKQQITKKWFGFIHLTPITPYYLYNLNLNYLFEIPNFINSLSNCLFLLTLSPYITDFIKNKLASIGLIVPVFTILHPSDIDCIHFSLEKYKSNKNKKIIQIGQQLRKITSIYKLKTNLKRIWLTGFRDMNRIKRMLSTEINEFQYKDIDYNSVEMKYLESFNEYDELLSENIVFIHLFDAGANNTIVECIARNTPILVNKIQGVVDYLGEDYPLYYNDLSEVNNLLTYENIEKTYYYLKSLDKSFLDINNFTRQFINIINNNL